MLDTPMLPDVANEVVCVVTVEPWFVILAFTWELNGQFIVVELWLSFSSLLDELVACWLIDVCCKLLTFIIDEENSEWSEFDSDFGSANQSVELLRT